MVGLSTSQQMSLKPSTRTHPKVFKLTDSESCENLQLEALLCTHTHTHTLACAAAAATTQMWTDGSAVPPVATKQRQGQNLLPLKWPTQFQGGWFTAAAAAGRVDFFTRRAHFLPVAHACGDVAGPAQSAMKEEEKKRPRRNVDIYGRLFRSTWSHAIRCI